jgi:3-oxoacyl-[acyl-carrier protein] reductase
MFRLDGHVALVTGAGQSMGAGIARLLATAGAAVAVNDLVAERAERTVKEIDEAGGAALAVPFDVLDLDAARAAVATVEDRLGHHVDILVNNAGIAGTMKAARFLDQTPQDWRGPIDLNIYGSLNCVHVTLPAMVAAGWGRIVQISSGAGRTGLNIGVSPYGTGKSGIEGFIRHLSQEVAASGVTANSLALGLMNNTSGDTTGHLARTIPARRLGTPQDVGATVVFLASPEASWLTGQTINLNGGSTTN